MDTLDEKRALILAEARQFAHQLASRVVPKPRVSFWMILLPVLFVFYMNDIQKYKKARREFAEHYVRTLERAVAEAESVIREGRVPEVSSMLQHSELSEEARARLSEVYDSLVAHVLSLLKAEGSDWGSLVRGAYGNKTNYLLFLNRLNRLEKRLNEALLPQLSASTEGAGEIIRAVEMHSEEIRRASAESIFS